LELGGDADPGAIERELRAKQMQLVEIEIERPLALHLNGLSQNVCGDERIAVAVAADPASRADEGGQVGIAPRWIEGRKSVFEIGIEARQLPQEGVVIV